MLEKYFDNENVFMISGGQFSPKGFFSNDDYTFSNYGHTGCGWATWKRAWNEFDLNVNDFNSFIKGQKLNKLVQTEKEKKYWTRIVMKMMRNGVGKNTWDICWAYIRLKEKGYSIVPRVNLTANIGVHGLHTFGETSDHYRDYDENFSAKIHPKQIERNIKYDKFHFENNLYKNRERSIILRALRKIKRILKIKYIVN